MSNYITDTKHPKTGKFEAAYWLDDYYGPHHYAVRFQDGTIVDTWEVKLETRDEISSGVDWDNYPDIPKRKEDE